MTTKKNVGKGEKSGEKTVEGEIYNICYHHPALLINIEILCLILIM